MRIQTTYPIVGISACYPEDKIDSVDLDFSDSKERDLFIKKMGIRSKRTSHGNYTVKDLGVKAIDHLLLHLNWKREEIDLLISVTQSPDYHVPGNSRLYQSALGLSEDCQFFDINDGCNGFIQGLQVALAYGQVSHASKIILVTGDTNILTDKSRTESYYLMGDAVCATALEKSSEIYDYLFSSKHFGTEYQAIYSKLSGARVIAQEKITSLSPLIFMDGLHIQSFISKNVIPQIERFEKLTSQDCLYRFVHQPNLMYFRYIVKKMDWNEDFCPNVLEDFGNISSASIPLTILRSVKKVRQHPKISCYSFGVGLTFAAVQCQLDKLRVTIESAYP